MGPTTPVWAAAPIAQSKPAGLCGLWDRWQAGRQNLPLSLNTELQRMDQKSWFLEKERGRGGATVAELEDRETDF